MDILDIAIAKQLAGGGGGSGTDNYNDLSNLPKINDVTLSGNKSSSALGLQSEITSENKLDSDLIDDTNQDNKFVTSTEKNTWNAKQNAIDADHKINADYVDDSTSTNKFVTATDKETWNAKQNAIDNSHKLSSDLVDDTNHTNKFVTSTEKNTWNGKQNAIDSEHKLSSSLVSFTTAEAAALASGIDSAKVAQISTNQSNILYGLEHGSKNQLNFDGWEAQGTGVTWKLNDDKTITATGTATSLSYITLKLNNNYVFADAFCDGLHYLSGCPTGGDFNTKYSLYLAKGSYNPVDTGTGVLIPTTSETEVRVVIKIASGFAIPSGGITFKPMICLKSVYDAYPEYQSYGAPNYDLTRLEAEDRAALAEEIDAGAKNLLSLSSKTIKQDSDNVVAVVDGATNEITLNISATAGTTCYIGLTSWIAPANGYYYLYAENATEANILVYDDGNWVTYNVPGQSKSPIAYWTKGTSRNIFLRVAEGTPAVTNRKIKVMICTKAAFGVSNKFVPYRPNYDFVCEGRIPPRTNGTIMSGNLNDFPTSYYLCSGAVANLPEYTGYAIVKTIVIDSNAALQEAFMLVGNKTYTRTKWNGTWNSWVQSTNVSS